MIKRHGALRSIIKEEKQFIFEEKIADTFCLETINIGREEKEKYFKKLRYNNQTRLRDLENWPLFDVKNICIDTCENFLLVDIEMIIVDGMSLQLILKDFWDIYSNSKFDVQEIDYLKCAKSVRETRDKRKYEIDKEYWMQRLPLIPNAPKLPECKICYINTVYSNSLASEIKKTERYIKRQENVASKMQQQILNIRCSQELLSKLNFSLKCKKEYHPLLLEELLDLRTESEIENIFDNFSQEYIQYSVEMRKKILAQTILFYMNKKGVLLKDIPCTLNQILKCLSVNTDNNDIIYRWIELLKKYNYVTETDGIYVCKIEIYEKGLKYGWEEVEYLWKGKLESPLVLDYIINNIKNWDKLIQKEQQATLLLFEQGEDIYADALYKETKILQYLNHSLSKKVLGYLYENANATILEIGAGTGATSDKVLSDIRENKFEEHIVYFYTDISRFFLQRAKERYKECDGKIEMHYQTLDIDEAFSSQLPSNFQADIVIAVGVLNNSVNTDKCIYEINSVMKPGGILLIIETVEDVPDILITQSFMMTEPKDQRKATNTMFLNRKQWLEILEENGFCNSEEFPGYGEYLEVLGQKLFYCTKE